MKRHVRPAFGFAGALLVVALAVAGCGRGPTDAAAANSPASEAVATAEASPTLDPEAAEVPSPETSDAASPAPIFDPGTAIDAVDSDLQALNQFLSGLDSSLSGSDGGAYGGE